MSRVCPVTGKGPISGNNRSHSLRATRRRWNTNLQVRTVIVDGKEMRIRMSTRAYRSLNKQYKDR
ncbi:MAG: 50S ribosomal protein L28 [Bacilli bacterium]|nr:50S ribosomal protein L28 [Bacilli bacterium]